MSDLSADPEHAADLAKTTIQPRPLVNPLDAVMWQDGLLQAYRSYQLWLQSMFSSAGAGLVAAAIGLTQRA